MGVNFKSCGKELARKRKTGMCKTCLLGTFNGSGNPNWRGNNISPEGMHMRIKVKMGYASEYGCWDCDNNMANEWSHIHGTSKFNIKNYLPRCYSCHRKYDHDTIHSKEAMAKMSATKTGVPWSKKRWDTFLKYGQ